MPCTQITIDESKIGGIVDFSFTKDHKNKIGIAKIEVSGDEWVPIKFYWADGVTEVISLEPGVKDEIGEEAAYGENQICVEIEGHPNTRICAEYAPYELYLAVGLAILVAILMFKR